jgi:uncharacterized cupin superfamily protein
MTEPAWADAPVAVVGGLDAALAEDVGGFSRSAELETTAMGEIGIWEIDPGTFHDVEVDEIFVVLSGRATIVVEGMSDVVVTAGDVVRLQAGAATTWIVTERLRKVYLAWGSGTD